MGNQVSSAGCIFALPCFSPCKAAQTRRTRDLTFFSPPLFLAQADNELSKAPARKEKWLSQWSVLSTPFTLSSANALF